MSKEVAKQTIDFLQDSGIGLEGADQSSFAIPFITILQGQSPQLESIDGAKPGLFFNTITDELFKEVEVIPCAFQRRYLRWSPREAGGGYKGDYLPHDVETFKIAGVTRDQDGRFMIEGDELKDTRNHFILFKNKDDIWSPALLSLTSTQIKKSKKWMSRIQGLEMKAPNGRVFTPPSFSHIYKLVAVKEENKKGSWWGVDIEMVGLLTKADVYNKAKEFNVKVTSGDVNVQHQNNAPLEDDEVPF